MIKTKASETWDNIKNSAIGQKVNEIYTNTKNKFDEIWKYALWLTIATSPYFLNQELAIKIVEGLLTK